MISTTSLGYSCFVDPASISRRSGSDVCFILASGCTKLCSRLTQFLCENRGYSNPLRSKAGDIKLITIMCSNMALSSSSLEL